MAYHQFKHIIEQIAKDAHTTPAQVLRKMEAAMKAGQSNPDPAIQAKWAAIPKKGKELTVEEFVEYCAARVTQFQHS